MCYKNIHLFQVGFNLLEKNMYKHFKRVIHIILYLFFSSSKHISYYTYYNTLNSHNNIMIIVQTPDNSFIFSLVDWY